MRRSFWRDADGDGSWVPNPVSVPDWRLQGGRWIVVSVMLMVACYVATTGGSVDEA